MADGQYTAVEARFAHAEVARDRDQFVRELIGELASVLEGVVGLDEASGFISIVGSRIGDRMNEDYKKLAGKDVLDIEDVAAALVDLKRRIQGGFRIESIEDDRIVLSNTACPFGEYVHGRESLCMMTSNVFGRIASANLGHAKVHVAEAIARGGTHCRVVVQFGSGRPIPDGEYVREYFSEHG